MGDDPAKPGELNEYTLRHGFERIGSELSLSPSHVDRYYRASELVLDRAFSRAAVERGGSLRFADPPAVVRELGDRAAAAVPRAFAYRKVCSCRMPLYLPIDAIQTAIAALLSECEGVEPELFFRARPGRTTPFAKLIEIVENGVSDDE